VGEAGQFALPFAVKEPPVLLTSFPQKTQYGGFETASCFFVGEAGQFAIPLATKEPPALLTSLPQYLQLSAIVFTSFYSNYIGS
jgi:hypothetical protein